MTEPPRWTPPEPGTTGGAGQPPAGPPQAGAQHGGQHRPPGWAPKPGVVALRPLGLGEILDGAVSFMRAHPAATLGPAAVLVVIIQVVLVPIRSVALSDLARAGQPLGEPANSVQALDALAGNAAVNGVAGLVTSVAVAVLTGLLIVVLSRSVLGQPASFAQAWSAVRARIPGLLGLGLLVVLLPLAALAVGSVPAVAAGLAGAPVGLTVLLGVLGGLAAVCAAVYLWVALALATPAYVLEETSVRAALGRSHRLVRTRWWPVFGTLVLAYLIAALIAGLVGLPFAFAGGALAGAFGGAETGMLAGTSLLALSVGAVGTIIGSTITWPFTAGVTGLLYYDQRMRREAFDLELGRAAAAPPPPPGA